MTRDVTIGVLAFQGDVREHLQALHAFGVQGREVRSISDLETVDALIIPGGESTVISRFLRETGLHEGIIERTQTEQFPIYGTCAGAILLAQDVRSDGKPETRVAPLRLMDITIERNAYGRQTESFEAAVPLHLGNGVPKCRAVFIRAPKITGVGKSVKILARHRGIPTVCEQGTLLVSTFHPELTSEPSLLHWYFLSLVRNKLNEAKPRSIVGEGCNVEVS